MNYRVRFHPNVNHDIAAIIRMVTRSAGTHAAAMRLLEIETTISGLAEVPHKGSIRSDIAPGLRAIPAGRKTVIAFTIDEEAQLVLVHTIGFAGSNWIAEAVLRKQNQ